MPTCFWKDLADACFGRSVVGALEPAHRRCCYYWRVSDFSHCVPTFGQGQNAFVTFWGQQGNAIAAARQLATHTREYSNNWLNDDKSMVVEAVFASSVTA